MRIRPLGRLGGPTAISKHVDYAAASGLKGVEATLS